LYFQVAPGVDDVAGAANTKMTITPNGDVGVGTTTPQSNFHVVGDVRVDGTITGAINQAVSAPSVIGISLLNSDGKIRNIDTELPLMTTLNETIDPNGSVTESRITFRMQQQTSFNFGNSLFDSVTGTMRLAVAPTANDTPTVDNTKMSITPNGDVGIGTTTPQSKLHVVGDVRVDGSITGAINSNVSAPSATGTSLLSSDGKLRTLDTQLPLLMTVNETTDNGIGTESNLTLGINTSGLIGSGSTWTPFTTRTSLSLEVTSDKFREWLITQEKDTDVERVNLIVEGIKSDGSTDTVSNGNWRFHGGPHAGDTITFDIPYLTGPTYGGTTDVITTELRVTRGKHRNHISGRSLHRHNGTSALVTSVISGFYDSNDLAYVRLSYQAGPTFSGEYMKIR